MIQNDIDLLGSGNRNAYTPWKPETSARAQMESSCRCSERFRLIAKAAGYLAEQRGSKVGHELEDWLKAEREVDGLLRR